MTPSLLTHRNLGEGDLGWVIGVMGGNHHSIPLPRASYPLPCLSQRVWQAQGLNAGSDFKELEMVSFFAAVSLNRGEYTGQVFGDTPTCSILE